MTNNEDLYKKYNIEKPTDFVKGGAMEKYAKNLEKMKLKREKREYMNRKEPEYVEKQHKTRDAALGIAIAGIIIIGGAIVFSTIVFKMLGFY